MMQPATFAQQAVWDAFADVTAVLKAGDAPSADQLEQVRDALALLKLEPQPDGFVKVLEMALDSLLKGGI
jgi:hypothetical protein